MKELCRLNFIERQSEAILQLVIRHSKSSFDILHFLLHDSARSAGAAGAGTKSGGI